MSSERMSAFPDETVNNPLQELYVRCTGEIAHTLHEVHERLATGGMVAYPGETIVSAATTMLTEAYKQDDMDQVDMYVSLLRRAPASNVSRAQGFAYAAMAGNFEASQELQNLLDEEKVSTLADALETIGDDARLADHFYKNPPLLSVATACFAKEGVPAETWIAKYAPSPKTRWHMLVRHNSALAGRQDWQYVAARGRLDTLCAELLDGAFDDDFVAEELPLALNEAQDPGLRLRLAKRFVELVHLVPPTLSALRTIADTCAGMARDPLLAESGLITHCKQEIDVRQERLHQSGVHIMAIAQALLPWRAAEMLYDGYNPKYIVSEVLGKEVGAILQQAEPVGSEDGTATFVKQGTALMQTRDTILRSYALFYAQKGAFDVAHHFLTAMATLDTRLDAMQDCVQYARTPQDVARMQPDSALLTVSPDASIPLQTKFALLDPDKRLIGPLAVEIAASFGDTYSLRGQYNDLKLRQLKLLHESQLVLNGQTVGVTARDVLSAIRKTVKRFDKADFLSRVLLHAGDSDELAYQYDVMVKGAISPVERLQRLCVLAKRISDLPSDR